MKVLPDDLMSERILLVQGDGGRQATASILEGTGFEVAGESDARKAVARACRERFDLAILEVAPPSVDGLTVCRELRRSSELPVVMLAARSDEADVVAALEVGADDYVTNPFRSREFVARIRAVLRRSAGASATPVITEGALVIDVAGMRVTHDGEPVDLTATEFRLLVELARHRGRVLSRQRLIQQVWEFDFLGGSRLVDMAVKRLREKLGEDGRHPRYIATVRGAGYRFGAEVPPANGNGAGKPRRQPPGTTSTGR